MSYKDHFSDRAASYAAYRPRYPDSLFVAMSCLPFQRRLALDCGTGNGQAAVGLANHFDQVVATDASRQQLAHAKPHPRIEYRVGRADSSGLPDSSVDLVTAAQALHWFDPAAFFAEAKRVLAPGGAIAVWGYGDPILDTPALHQTLNAFNRGTLESYWSPERELLLNGYRDIDFPFVEVELPTFVLEMNWTLGELVGYARTWSATSAYLTANGFDPVIELEAALTRDWGDSKSARHVRWPLYVRAGRI